MKNPIVFLLVYFFSFFLPAFAQTQELEKEGYSITLSAEVQAGYLLKVWRVILPEPYGRSSEDYPYNPDYPMWCVLSAFKDPELATGSAPKMVTRTLSFYFETSKGIPGVLCLFLAPEGIIKNPTAVCSGNNSGYGRNLKTACEIDRAVKLRPRKTIMTNDGIVNFSGAKLDHLVSKKGRLFYGLREWDYFRFQFGNWWYKRDVPGFEHFSPETVSGVFIVSTRTSGNYTGECVGYEVRFLRNDNYQQTHIRVIPAFDNFVPCGRETVISLSNNGQVEFETVDKYSPRPVPEKADLLPKVKILCEFYRALEAQVLSCRKDLFASGPVHEKPSLSPAAIAALQRCLDEEVFEALALEYIRK